MTTYLRDLQLWAQSVASSFLLRYLDAYSARKSVMTMHATSTGTRSIVATIYAVASKVTSTIQLKELVTNS